MHTMFGVRYAYDAIAAPSDVAACGPDSILPSCSPVRFTIVRMSYTHCRTHNIFERISLNMQASQVIKLLIGPHPVIHVTGSSMLTLFTSSLSRKQHCSFSKQIHFVFFMISRNQRVVLNLFVFSALLVHLPVKCVFSPPRQSPSIKPIRQYSHGHFSIPIGSPQIPSLHHPSSSPLPFQFAFSMYSSFGLIFLLLGDVSNPVSEWLCYF
jgi:hypothetical protein